ncbi:MAG TPA: cytochrome c-type biogenesis protein CcmH [Thermomicrobiales bacterium]|nr:cytochrome c-type biogenesis protein CcmH [Thermomicrobiales bacterium]
MKRRRSLSVLFAALAVLGVVMSASAQDVYSPRTLELSRRLHCPVCAGQSVADSNSELARQIRGIIEEKVQAGESDQQILDYFVARYGVSILADPPKSGIGLGLWWMPVAVVLVGAAVVVTYLRERTRLPVTAAVDDHDEELDAIARDVLSHGNEAASR